MGSNFHNCKTSILIPNFANADITKKNENYFLLETKKPYSLRIFLVHNIQITCELN